MPGISLRTKYLIVTIGIVLSLGIAIVIFVHTVLSEKLLNELQKRGVTIASAIARKSADLILTEKIVDLQILINDYKNSEENIEYIFVVDSDRDILAHTFNGGFPVNLKEANIVDSGETYSVQPLTVEKGEILDISIPILRGGAGFVRVGVTEEPFKEGVAAIIQLFVGIIIALSILAGVAAVFFAQVITKPIFELTKVAKFVGSGDLEHKVSVRTKDEIGQLGAVFNDMIEERKRDEKELKDSEEKYRDLYDNAPDMYHSLNKSGIIIDCNKTEARMLGYKNEEIIGRPLTDFLTEESKRLFERDFPRLNNEQVQLNVEREFVRKDGTIFPASLNVFLEYDEDGYFYRTKTIARDITERKKAEEAILQEKNRLEVITESMNCGLLLLDDQARVTYANSVSEEWFGPFHQIKGKLCWELFKLNDPEKECAALQVFRTGKIVRSETFMKVVNEEDKFFYVVASPVKDSNGKIYKITEVVIDITDRKSIEDKLKKSYEKLQELSRHLEKVREEERTNVAREIHDELGQALTALRMDTSWLSKKLPGDQESLVEKTQSMIKMINDTIHTVKKISSKLRPSVLDHFGLAAAIEWQAKEFQTRSGIHCKVTVDPEEISLDKNCSTAIFRILQEALTNVARHAGATKVKISLKQNSDRIILTISDNGKGITKEQTSKPKSYGLMGVRERINSLKGDITIDGTPNKGTKIKVVIPLDNMGGVDAESIHS
jgi:PAS domain S-box-containing protein